MAASDPIPGKLMKCPADKQAVAEGCWYDKKAADKAVAFFTKFLRHSKGEWAGKAFVPLDWEEWDVLRPLFGWKRPDGTRRFRRALIMVPKKNGKSTICAGIALYLLIADGEPGAEVYSAAADVEQASIVFREASSMAKSSPALESRLNVVDGRRVISDAKTNSWYKVLSSDVPTKDGLNIHGLIFDELHTQPNRKLWDTLKYGGAARRQPLYVAISTAGVDRTGLCYDQYKYAKGILKGTVRDIYYYACIFELEEQDDWSLEANWRKANPSYGTALKADQFREDYIEASQNVASENNFRRYRLNQWTQQETRWIEMPAWRKCTKAVPELVKQDQFFGGLDLASTQDIAAYIQLFYGKGFYVKCHFYIPKDRLRARVQKDHVPYDLWERQGFLTATRGNVIDEEHIIEDVLKSGAKNKCREIGYDPWNAPHIVTRLSDEGVEMVPVRQGFISLNYPCKELTKLIVAQRLNHGNNPILEWMANNVAVDTDAADNIKPSKKLSHEKIDGIAALVNALARYLVHHNIKPSKYETEAMTIL